MRRLLAALVGLGAFLLPAAGAAAASPGAGSGVQSPGSPGVQLLQQTPWLQGPGQYLFRVALSGAAPTDQIQVTVFDQLITRTSFDQAAVGKVNDFAFYQQPVPLSDLPGNLSQGVDVSLPVNQTPPAGDPFKQIVQIGETGVFPVQISIVDASGVPQGKPLTTFIVYAQHTVSAGAVKPLSAALIIPFASPPVVGPSGGLAPPDAAETQRLDRLATVLNGDSSVPASILASPLTLDELAVGSSAGRAVLSQLNGATVDGPLDVLPTTYSPVSLADLQTFLPGEITPQLATASSTLKSVFGTAPNDSTWVVDGPLDGTALSVLIAHHARQVIVPSRDLTSLPNVIDTTFARSTKLSYAGNTLTVVAADSTLTDAFGRSASPVLAANQLLAEMAMIYTETPSVTRGVAVMPPAGWTASPTFISTLLAGLKGNPLVSAVTASRLFQAIGQPQGTRYLAADQGSGPGFDQVGRIAAARSQIFYLSQILGRSPQIAELNKQILLAESSELTDAQRATVLDAIDAKTVQVQHAASLPPATTITLTATKGAIPLTILAAGNLHPRVQLHLRSQKLIFRPFQPPEGTCQVISDTEEVCTLTLTSQNTTLKVPVETRSSGVFPVDVSLEVPGTAKVLVKRQDTVRSTAVSGVAVIVIVLALVGLIVWWVRDLRRGRRPERLAPSPLGDPDGSQVTAGDPEVDGFFETPPPEFGEGNDDGRGAAMSPSGTTAGPSTTTRASGQARESRKQ